LAWKGAIRVESRTFVADFRAKEVVRNNFRHGICGATPGRLVE